MKLLMIIVGLIFSFVITEAQALDVKSANDLISKTLKDAGAASGVNNNLRVDLVKGQNMIEEIPATAKLAVTKLDFDTKAGTFTAFISVDGNLPFETAGNFTETTKVPVLSHKLDKSDVIAQSDITYIDIDKSKLRDNFITKAELLVGKAPTRQILKERPIVLNQVAAAKVIDKNKQIAVIYKNDAITIKTLGIALDSGSIGESVRVKNIASNKVIRAKVIDGGNAEVTNGGNELASN